MKLILGYGLLGSEIHKQTEWNYISRKKDGIDFADINTYESYLKKLGSGVSQVINCIAQTNTVNESDQDVRKCWEVNYKGVMNLTDFCNDNNIKLIHISTDYVYANSDKLANEARDIPIHYDNFYTYTKLLADSYIQARSKNHLIMRSSFKPKPFPFEYGWIDLIGNFDYVDVIAKLMIELIEYDAQGTFNVGTEVKTLYELAKRTNKKVKPSFKEKQHIKSNDVSMSITKMENFLKIERGKRTNEFRFNS
jgi:dTDP-4-dehydrorhamnose reductase